MTTMVRPVSIQNTDLGHGWITLLLVLKIVLDMKEILECHSKVQGAVKLDVYKRQEPGRFKYLTRYNDHTVSLAADPNAPFFVTYRWDSSTSPAILGEFAELVGGFDDIHYCFGDYPVGSPSWSIWHYVVKMCIRDSSCFVPVPE